MAAVAGWPLIAAGRLSLAAVALRGGCGVVDPSRAMAVAASWSVGVALGRHAMTTPVWGTGILLRTWVLGARR
jgi:hypothetical protein